MSNEEKKKYLNGYRNVCLKIVDLKEQLESLRLAEQQAKGQQLSDMPKGGHRQQDLSDVIIRIETLKDKIDKEIIKSMNRRIEIENTILGVEDAKEKTLLRLRYLEMLKWEEICVRMKYSWKQIHRLHAKALEKITVEKDDIE